VYWKHLECVTPTTAHTMFDEQYKHMTVEDIAGYSDLEPKDQKKVKKVFMEILKHPAERVPRGYKKQQVDEKSVTTRHHANRKRSKTYSTSTGTKKRKTAT
jgi:hypothetical protein